MEETIENKNEEVTKEADATAEKQVEAKEETSEKTAQQGTERKMYKTTCSDCKQECEVPFEPTEGRPVYCKECYQKHKQNNIILSTLVDGPFFYFLSSLDVRILFFLKAFNYEP